VSVGSGVKGCEGAVVSVRVGIGVKVSVGGMPVDVSAATGEGEVVGSPLLKLQARVIAIKRMRK